MVLTCIKTVDNTGDLSLIILWNTYLTLYLSDIATKKVKKTLITKNTCKTKNIWFACKSKKFHQWLVFFNYFYEVYLDFLFGFTFLRMAL